MPTRPATWRSVCSALGEYYQDLSSAELKERQDFLLENTPRSRSRSVDPRSGNGSASTSKACRRCSRRAKIDRGKPLHRLPARASSQARPNVRKLGLLDANNGYLREKWGEAGLLEYEFADDTATDYETYDEVARDRVGPDSA